MKAGSDLPEELLGRPVAGLNLAPGLLRDQLDPDFTLIVFLRHFGCMFCRETLSDIREASEKDDGFPTPLFFFQGTPTEGRAFLRRYWPGLRAVADPRAEFYDAFGVGRGGLIKMLGPAVWSAKARAEAKGHHNGERMNDIWRMPGLFLIRGRNVLWSHDYRHAADQPDYQLISKIAAESLEKSI